MGEIGVDSGGGKNPERSLFSGMGNRELTKGGSGTGRGIGRNEGEDGPERGGKFFDAGCPKTHRKSLSRGRL